MIARNDIDAGTAADATRALLPADRLHARDADTIVGDNGNIFRPVSWDGSAYLSFRYDRLDLGYSADLKLIPRAVALLD